MRVLAAPVCLPDVQSRYGRTPFPPRMPFTPGYAVVGDVDAVGRGVTRVGPGDRVAALTGTGGYADAIELHERALIPVPTTVEPTEAAVIVLNYLVAYQTLHRVARVAAGDSILVVGASGGIGTALLDLGRYAGLRMVGLASPRKHVVVEHFGAAPVDYHRPDLRDRLHWLEPNGFHAVLDGVGGTSIDLGLALLRRNGILVSYANPGSFRGLVALLAKLVVVNLLSKGKALKVYGTTATFANRRPLFDDWATLFDLLARGAIHPVIHDVFALSD
ncbi:MAG: zinc-binding dehydrogenase, partial [Deinococcales bacterium]